MRIFTRPWCIGGLVLGVTLLWAGLVQAQGEYQTYPLLVAQKAAPQEPKQPPQPILEPPPEPALAPKPMPKESMPETMERQMERRGPSDDVPAKPGTRKFGAQPIRAKETPGD
ncbi:MAG: hypothetical protein WC443_12160 [Desulfobaccales bacterium]